MKLTGPACTEMLSEAEVARTRKSKPARAGGVRVERRVRHCDDSGRRAPRPARHWELRNRLNLEMGELEA